jgi:hypothetical protein
MNDNASGDTPAQLALAAGSAGPDPSESSASWRQALWGEYSNPDHWRESAKGNPFITMDE